MPRPSSALALVALSLAPAGAAADDWLALAPACSYPADARALGRMALLYPRVGLPAVVHAGDRLVTRVRVPSGLTPPPGIQQNRALVGWSAELLGDGRPLFGGAAEHRYPSRIVDVRPDGASTLVYRATIRVPPWAAPGTYSLRLTAPGGSDSVASSVRILPAGAVPRIGVLGTIEGEERARLETLADLPVDVLVARDSPALRRALDAPVVSQGRSALPAVLLRSDEGPAVVLRVARRAHVLGACDASLLPFDELVTSLLEREGLERAEIEHAAPTGGVALPGGERLTPRYHVGAAFERRGEAQTIRAGAGGMELTVLLPVDGQATTVVGGEHAFWAATPVWGDRAAPTVALRLSIADVEAVTVTRNAAAPVEATIEVSPSEVESGAEASLTLRSDTPLALVGWQIAGDDAAVGETVRHSFGVLGSHTVHAMAISEQGVGARATRRVDVVTREVRGCGSSACSTNAGTSASLETLLVVPWLVIRSRRRAR